MIYISVYLRSFVPTNKRRFVLFFIFYVTTSYFDIKFYIAETDHLLIRTCLYLTILFILLHLYYEHVCRKS